MGDGRQQGSSTGGTPDESDTAVMGAPPPTGAAPGPDVVVVGGTVARYVVLEQVGRGGMGRVFRAYDPKLQREVALKEVRQDRLSAEGTRRLVAEARAMAMLSHPHVVAVYDVEELGDGRVVLVMEYVPGQTLRTWLREQPPDWRVRVEPLVAAGRGLVAAHAAGLLHRDFKPSNVLISEQGVVKVTDFGLAKASGTGGSLEPSQRSGSASAPGSRSQEEVTETGVVLGTPRYMAPEQYRGEALTAAADQYALCISLWEALCGEPPFSGDNALRQKVGGPPSWPEATTPKRIAAAIRRGLSAGPSRRWPSVEALLEALAYDAAKGRRVVLTFGAGAAAVVALGGAGWMSWSEARTEPCTSADRQLVGVWDDQRKEDVRSAITGIQAPYAARVWEDTRMSLDAYAASWTTMHAAACEATMVRGEQSSAVMDLRMRCLHRAKVELQAVVGELENADAAVVQNAHQMTSGLRSVRRCADVEVLRADVEPPRADEADAVERIETLLAVAKAAGKAGRYSGAREAVRAAKAALRNVTYGPLQAEVALAEAENLDELGEYEAAEEELRRALELASFGRQYEAMSRAATLLMYVVGVQRQEIDEALRYRDLAQGLARIAPLREAHFRNNLGLVLEAHGTYEEAETEHRRALELRKEALGPRHPDVAASRNNLANVLYAQGEYEAAAEEHRQVLALREETLGPRHPKVGSSLSNLGNVLYTQQEYEEAEIQHRRAIAIREQALGGEHPYVASSRNNLANALYGQKKFEEAEVEHRHALAVRESALGADHPKVAQSRNNLALVLRAQGNYPAAEAEHRRALEGRSNALGSHHPDVAQSRNNLAMVLQDQGKFGEAEAEHRLALAAWNESLRPDHPHLAQSRHNLARLVLEQGRAAEALEFAEQAWDRRREDDTPVAQRAETAFVLARALWAAPPSPSSRSRARDLARRAREAYARDDELHEESLQAVDAWLAAHRTD